MRKWTRQPQGVVEALYGPDLVVTHNRVLNTTGAVARIAGPHGVSLNTVGSSKYINASVPSKRGAISFLCLVKFNSFGGATFGGANSGATIHTTRYYTISPTLCVSNGGFTGSVSRVWFGTDAAGTAVGYANSQQITTGKWYAIGVSREASATTTKIVVNGFSNATSYLSAGSDSSAWGDAQSWIGHHPEWSGNEDQEIALLARFPSALSEAQLLDLAASPDAVWGMFRPIQRRIYVPATGGTTTTVSVGSASEADAAQAIGRQKVRAVGAATEAESAQPFTVRKSLAVAAATETDAAQAIASTKRIAVGHAAETDTAQAITAVGQLVVSLSAATESDAAQDIGKVKILALGAASESDAAQTITRYVPGVQTIAVDPATETDSSQAIGARKVLSLGSISETDAAQIILPRKVLALQPATEADSAQDIAWSPKIRQLGVATETDAAQAIAVGAAALTLEQKCDLLLKILTNKTVTDPATGLMTIYDDDDTTPLLTASLFEDAAAAIPYRGRGAERREKLSPP